MEKKLAQAKRVNVPIKNIHNKSKYTMGKKSNDELHRSKVLLNRFDFRSSYMISTTDLKVRATLYSITNKMGSTAREAVGMGFHAKGLKH